MKNETVETNTNNPSIPTKRRRLGVLLVMGLLTIVLGACAPKTGERVDCEAFALDTIITLSLWTNDQVSAKEGEKILKEAEALCIYYENMLSKTVETSDVYRLNHSDQWQVVSPQTAALLEKGIYYGELTKGNFDITISQVKDLWDFKAEHPKVPAKEAVVKALETVDYHYIQIGNEKEYKDAIKGTQMGKEVRLAHGAQVDLGGIAKGYIADELVQFLKDKGVQKAIINLGGNVVVIGEKEKDIPWKVGIQNPDGEQNSYIGSVEIRDASVVTSGEYERFFAIDGLRYHHLLNPFDGHPADNSLASVTILSKQSVDGDVLSTGCFVMGKEEGIQLIESLPEVEALFIEKDGTITGTSGMESYHFAAKGN